MENALFDHFRAIKYSYAESIKTNSKRAGKTVTETDRMAALFSRSDI